MCGIAGILSKEGLFSTTAEVVQMLNVQRHRGPDDSGVMSFSFQQGTGKHHAPASPEEIAGGAQGLLGFNRLSIVDLSANGHQPMSSSDQMVTLVFNGEIYNAPAYRGELERAGFTFRGHSDTEVILNLYLKYGFDEMVRRLNGMFALVLVDLRVRKCYMARDRFGIKPLYILEDAKRVAFASEIKSLCALPGFEPVLRTELLDEYLLFRNTIHRTLFAGIDNLEPGKYREYNPDGSYLERTFWELESLHRAETTARLEQSREILRSSLRAAVRRQLMSDVKVGCQLSGGVDSSLVTWFASEELREKLETVSIIFEDPQYSEEPFIRTVSESLGVVAHCFPLDASYYGDAYQKATWHLESPLNHPNTIGIYLLSQKARQHVTVLLSGEGADEVFGGYARFAQVCNPMSVRALASWWKRGQWSPGYGMKFFSEAWRAIFPSAFMQPHLAARLKEDFSLDAATRERKRLYHSLSGSTFDKQVKYELGTYLPDLLMRQDKMSMAHSMENRVPFLDNELVNTSFGFPVSHLVGDGTVQQTKWLLKDMAANKWGKSFAMREKSGFGIPVRRFFDNPMFLTYLRDEVLPGIRQRGRFDAELVDGWIKNLGTITSAELDALWIMVAFEVWAKTFRVR